MHSNDDITILDLPIPEGWENLFNNSRKDLEYISKFIEKEKAQYGMVLPDTNNIFKIYELLKPEDIKVIIIGQEPYNQVKLDGTPKDQGIAFSLSRDDYVNSTLSLIFDEIKRSYDDIYNLRKLKNVNPFVTPSHGDLTKWIEQGVFLLNMSLTTRINTNDAHGRRWMGFIIRTIQEIHNKNPNVIYLLWGNKAQSLRSYIKNPSIVYTSQYPSKNNYGEDPFNGCNHFVKVNETLESKDKNPINWNI